MLWRPMVDILLGIGTSGSYIISQTFCVKVDVRDVRAIYACYCTQGVGFIYGRINCCSAFRFPFRTAPRNWSPASISAVDPVSSLTHWATTRAWKVFDVEEQRVTFLKDTWRIDVDNIDPEGLTYRKLHESNVSNIATVDASGDVGGKTMTQLLTDDPWSRVKDKITGHIHYRLALKEVGISLKPFSNTKQLVIVICDCIKGKTPLTVRGVGLIIATAFGEALSKANILHRDFSVGKVTIFLDENGYPVRGPLITGIHPRISK